MRAYILPRNSQSVSELRRVELPDPAPPGPGQVAVRIRAASLNYRDQAVASGRYVGGPLTRDTVPLSDGAGEVIAIGAGVSRVKVGESVVATFMQIDPTGPRAAAPTTLGAPLDGMLTERIVLYEDGVLPLPAGYSFEEAATLPCAAVTAWHALMVAGRPTRPGDTVLVLGTGGVSMFALQFARAAGAAVIATSSSDEKLARLQPLGISGAINYRTHPDWAAEVLKLTHGRGVDTVVETVGTGTLNQSFAALAYAGKVTLIGILVSGECNPYLLMRKQASLHGVFVGDRGMFEAMLAAIQVNALRPMIDRVFDFEDAQEAYRYQLAAQFMGKIVIRI
ncbi:MAG TPA: NAD(P)-dependent alcohol dehydrogenase [Steroidobacteraceae bacterium]|nr:NAD(P)-dependent alcohol dehydrogenase [Steroidobacteraceae bacterium]